MFYLLSKNIHGILERAWLYNKLKGGLPTYIISGPFFFKKKDTGESRYLRAETELDKKLYTRQPSAAAEARQISGAQGWEGEGVRGQSPPPPCWGWPGGPGRGGWVGGLEGFGFRRVTVALLREGMDVWLGAEVLRADGFANAWYLKHGMGSFLQMNCIPFFTCIGGCI